MTCLTIQKYQNFFASTNLLSKVKHRVTYRRDVNENFFENLVEDIFDYDHQSKDIEPAKNRTHSFEWINFEQNPFWQGFRRNSLGFTTFFRGGLLKKSRVFPPLSMFDPVHSMWLKIRAFPTNFQFFTHMATHMAVKIQQMVVVFQLGHEWCQVGKKLFLLLARRCHNF